MPVHMRKKHTVSWNTIRDRMDYDPETGHWAWKGTLARDGTPIMPGGNKTARRAVWELQHGSVPDGKQIGQICGHKRCVAPEHLAIIGGE